MRILGADLAGDREDDQDRRGTLVLLDSEGRIGSTHRPLNLADLATTVVDLVNEEPFLLAVNVPVVGTASTRPRPVDNLLRRRAGFRTGAPARGGGGGRDRRRAGEALVSALAAAGHPCLPYPDRDRRRSGLAEIHGGLVVKALLWETSAAARPPGSALREELFRAFGPPARGSNRSRQGWADRAVAVDLLLRCLRGEKGYDLVPATEALATAVSDEDVDAAEGLLEAALLAGTALRYLDSPEACAFAGDTERGYTILPADGFVRRLVLRDRPTRDRGLFPRASLSERLGGAATLRPVDLLNVPGKPERFEAVFADRPRYEFDNLDELLWWKHCRHLSGPALPTEGLQDLWVRLDADDRDGGGELKLVRSRHRTLSFRFEPPRRWRARVPTRDGKTYPFHVLRATYETAPES